MKKLLIALTCLSFAGCASNPAVYDSTSQNYRPKGQDLPLQIKGRLIHQKNLLSSDYAVVFTVDNEFSLGFQLDNSGNGSMSCTSAIESENGQTVCHPHNNNPIGANCIGSTVNGKLAGAQCTFTYNNEIAANFKF